MQITLHNGLPTVSIQLSYKGNHIKLPHLLLDTGCAVSIFDTDMVEPIGLVLDLYSGIPVRMYDVGGQSELVY